MSRYSLQQVIPTGLSSYLTSFRVYSTKTAYFSCHIIPHYTMTSRNSVLIILAHLACFSLHVTFPQVVCSTNPFSHFNILKHITEYTVLVSVCNYGHIRKAMSLCKLFYAFTKFPQTVFFSRLFS